jgi:hypothetical protein
VPWEERLFTPPFTVLSSTPLAQANSLHLIGADSEGLTTLNIVICQPSSKERSLCAKIIIAAFTRRALRWLINPPNPRYRRAGW